MQIHSIATLEANTKKWETANNPEGWLKTYETKSLVDIAKEKGWKLENQPINSSNERKILIKDSSGNLIGEAHLGHKEVVNGKQVVVQDHFHLKSNSKNIHYILPDKK